MTCSIRQVVWCTQTSTGNLHRQLTPLAHQLTQSPSIDPFRTATVEERMRGLIDKASWKRDNCGINAPQWTLHALSGHLPISPRAGHLFVDLTARYPCLQTRARLAVLLRTTVRGAALSAA